MTTKSKNNSITTKSLANILTDTASASRLIRASGTEYLGPCIVQCEGSWTRVGPTWVTQRGIWVVFGPGLSRWGTTEGLAQLSISDAVTPVWHSIGVGIVPTPHICFPVMRTLLSASHMETVRLCTEIGDEMQQR